MKRLIATVFIFAMFLAGTAHASLVKYSDTVQDRNGKVVPSATVEVVETGTTTAVTIYSDAAGATVKSAGGTTLTDTNGYYWFYIEEGRYDITISKSNFTTQTKTDVYMVGASRLSGANTWSGVNTFSGGIVSSGATTFSGAVNATGAFTTTSLKTINNSIELVSQYATLNAAVTAIGSSSKTLYLDAPITMTATTTAPATLSIQGSIKGTITKVAGTLTINGPFSAGLYQVFSGFSAGDVTFGSGSVKEVYPEWWNGDLQASVDSRVPVILQNKTYSYTPPLIIRYDSTEIRGAGRYLSVLSPTATAANALEIGSTVSVDGVVLKDFKILGNATVNNGIVIGNQSPQYYSINMLLERIYIAGFTKTNAAGIKINTSWWSTFSSLNLENNYNGVHIPSGAVTTTLLFDKNMAIRTSTNIGFLAEGAAAAVDGVTMRNVSFEYNEKGAIKSTAAKAIYAIENTYFEQNNASGTAVIEITGGSSAYEYTMIDMQNCTSDAPLSGEMLKLDYVSKSKVENCHGFISGTISTTATCDVSFSNMNGQSAGDFLATARTLLGIINAKEYRVAQGVWETYSSAAHYFEGHLASLIATAPTVTVESGAGVGASAVMLAGSTDTRGQVQVTFGASGWIADKIFTVTFNKAYVTVPTVILTPASNKAGSEQSANGPSAVATTTTFHMNFANAETASGAAYWNYIVIQ